MINSSNYIVAKYLYDAYGNLLSQAGIVEPPTFIVSQAKSLIRTQAWFTTYIAIMIRICSGGQMRDPIEEVGWKMMDTLPTGIWNGNCYTFLGNRAGDAIDPLGLYGHKLTVAH